MENEDGSRSLYLLGDGLNIILLNILTHINGFGDGYVFDKYELYSLLSKKFSNKDTDDYEYELLEKKKVATSEFFDVLVEKINDQRSLSGILTNEKMNVKINEVVFKQNRSNEDNLIRLFLQIAVSSFLGNSNRANNLGFLYGVKDKISKISYNKASFGIDLYVTDRWQDYNFEMTLTYNDPKEEEGLYPFKIKFESEKHLRGDFVPVVEIKKEAKYGYVSPSIKFIVSYFALDLLKMAIYFASFYLTNSTFRNWVDSELEKIKEIDRDEYKDFLGI